ncbi:MULTISPECIES: transporter [unclassified Pseudomonas]|uniref:transporter n=1 Tax=unclassified Pseudomonas TaxID=196821 RepID=UPI00128F8401|nr:transporter [Pseudomonas sp. MN1F]MQG95495.1 transporter [Pseudomonas sp. MN1F]
MASKHRPCVVRLAPLSLAPLLLAAQGANAEDLEPRAYANTPVGINFLLLGYSDLRGNVTANPSVPLEDAKLDIETVVFAYARSLDVWGRSAKFDVVVPEARLSGSALFAGEPRERNVSGLIDPRLRFSVNWYGAPALSLAEFPSYQQDVIIGTSLAITAPLGQYDSSRLVNLGNNRWSFKPEIGISKRIGAVTLELSGAGTFFTDNNQYLGNRSFSQRPIYQTQVHLIYAFQNGVWASLDGTYFAGGNTSVDGVGNHDFQENTRYGCTLTLPVNRNNSVKLFASNGAHTRTGSEFDVAGVVWQYRFGGGL